MEESQTRARGCFLFLQGPHGPFFKELGAALRSDGHEVWRVGFNRGDERFWHDAARYIPFTGRIEDWPETFRSICAEKRITDIVLYGDTRRIHSEAVSAARAAGITVHVFEEGYLRPFWVTYERGGSNGHSRLMTMTIDGMRRDLPPEAEDQHPPPAHWGDMRQHIFYGALYHFHVMLRNHGYRNFSPHRGITVGREFRLHLRRLLLMPLHRAERFAATMKIRLGRFPYHLVLLQLEHDASFRNHSNFHSMTDFIELCLSAFAEGASQRHHLILKAHPLEDGRAAIPPTIRRIARETGISDRVHFVRGGKLAALLDRAESVVTVNSTAAQQALWRGLPVRALGRAIYAKPELVSDQPLPAFFRAPRRPDIAAYRDFRRYLLDTCQVPGGFYSARGRRLLIPQLPRMMTAPEDPFDTLAADGAAALQQS
ncbi:capsule biosynthesis protein CapA [Ostreiculturibacter nitratireducens]|uniref:capsule biosynthesis protein n=1 Tax=Ostreiculturibacter nitratireducens TaxID=3075226 RepID=UPI0031B5BCE5